jgi:RHS repeat-associated protein
VTAGTLTSAAYSQTFGYDNMNRLTSGPAGSYTYGDSAHLHAATAVGSAYTAKYDASGDMTCRAPSSSQTCAGTPTGAALSYDNEGRLTAWQNAQSSPTSTDNFLYDGEGNRVEQQSAASGTTTTTIYVGGVEELRTISGSTTTTTYYTLAGQRIALAVNGTLSYLASDLLGSATVALDGAGNVSASQLFAPYGTSRYSSGTMPTDRGFTGHHADAVTGLDYYNARYYDPAIGQFSSADLVLDGLNRYAYVGGNPETSSDPSGNDPVPPFWPVVGPWIPIIGGFELWLWVGSQSPAGESQAEIDRYFARYFAWQHAFATAGAHHICDSCDFYPATVKTPTNQGDGGNPPKPKPPKGHHHHTERPNKPKPSTDGAMQGGGGRRVWRARGDIVREVHLHQNRLGGLRVNPRTGRGTATAGGLVISNSATGVTLKTFGPYTGTNERGGESHAENQAVEDAVEWLSVNGSSLATDGVTIDIITHRKPCDYECQPRLISDEWLMRLQAAAPETNIMFTIWAYDYGTELFSPYSGES